jgi:TnpA family transposase
METILDKNNLDMIADKILELCKNDLNAQKLESYQKQISALDNELNKLTKLIKNAFEIDEDLYNKLIQDFKDTKLQKKDKEQEIQKLKNANVIKHTKESITAFIKQFTTDTKYKNENRRIVQDFINTVWIADEYYIVFIT